MVLWIDENTTCLCLNHQRRHEGLQTFESGIVARVRHKPESCMMLLWFLSCLNCTSLSRIMIVKYHNTNALFRRHNVGPPTLNKSTQICARADRLIPVGINMSVREPTRNCPTGHSTTEHSWFSFVNPEKLII